MSPFKIGVMSASFRKDTRESIRTAKELGAQGVQIYAQGAEIAPEEMDAAARAEFRAFIAGEGLEISALCGDLGGHGFQIAEENPPKIARSKLIVDLARDLGTSVVTTHIGCVPGDAASASYGTMLEACRELGRYAHNHGVDFAIETGPETAKSLADFLDDVATPGICVNYDPANLVMVTGDDPVQGVHALKKYIVHTHAKDGVKFKPCDAEEIYHGFAVGGIEGLNFGDYFDEVPLGQGKVDWDAYLAALSEIGYSGYLTIEREVGDDPEKDIRTAVEFLKSKI